jgi:hypothetical protein
VLTLEPAQEPAHPGYVPEPRSLVPTAPTGPVPRTLPARAPCFVGHAGLLDALRRRLTAGGDLVAVITGPGGVGKSSVAIEAAHELAAEFPDGQLYARAENTGEVLAQFLRALGFSAQEIPADLDAMAALYRCAIAGRRILVVVEDAVDEAQVEPLVPGTPSCRLIVTTRARTAEAPGTAVFELDPLDAPGGIELLTAGIGRRRVAAEPHAAAELVELCGGLPLALYGAMTQLAVRTYWTIDHLVEHLRDGQRLDRLSYRGVDVRATLRRGCRHLPAPARSLFARLGLLESGEYAAWVAAPLLDLDPHAAADALEALVDARLVDVVPGGYRLPELTRLYARELALDEPEQERAAALRRLSEAEHALRAAATVRYSVSEPGLQRHHDTPTIPAVAPPRPPRLELVASADTGAYTDNTVSARNRVVRRLPRRNPTPSRKESGPAADH